MSGEEVDKVTEKQIMSDEAHFKLTGCNMQKTILSSSINNIYSSVAFLGGGCIC
jgi:hypothetical protein